MRALWPRYLSESCDAVVFVFSLEPPLDNASAAAVRIGGLDALPPLGVDYGAELQAALIALGALGPQPPSSNVMRARDHFRTSNTRSYFSMSARRYPLSQSKLWRARRRRFPSSCLARTLRAL